MVVRSSGRQNDEVVRDGGDWRPGRGRSVIEAVLVLQAAQWTRGKDEAVRRQSIGAAGEGGVGGEGRPARQQSEQKSGHRRTGTCYSGTLQGHELVPALRERSKGAAGMGRGGGVAGVAPLPRHDGYPCVEWRSRLDRREG